MELSVVIVNWNTRALLKGCLESIRKQNFADPFEVIVVDNGSQDGSCEMVKEFFPEVVLIELKRNLGFAKGTNIGIKISSGEFILLLNSDIFVPEGALRKLVDFARAHPEAGAVAPKLLYPNGTFQESRRRLPKPRVLLSTFLGLSCGSWKMKDTSPEIVHIVEQPMMSALLIRRKCWNEVGFLDEAFPIFFNDVDWCWRLYHNTKWQILYFPEVHVYHVHGASTKNLGKFRRTLESQRSMYLFFKKHLIKNSSPVASFFWISVISFLSISRLLFAIIDFRKKSY